VRTNLYYAHWGLNFGGWELIGTKNMTVAGNTEIQHTDTAYMSGFFPHRYDDYFNDRQNQSNGYSNNGNGNNAGSNNGYSSYGYNNMYGGVYGHGLMYMNPNGYNNAGSNNNDFSGMYGDMYGYMYGNRSFNDTFLYVPEDNAHKCYMAAVVSPQGSNTNTSVMYVYVFIYVNMCVCVPQDNAHKCYMAVVVSQQVSNTNTLVV
jgi:hypothetical protein